MTLDQIKELVESQFPNAVVGEDLTASPQALVVRLENLHAVCEFLHASKETYFDSLSCLTGIDNGKETDKMEVVYNLYSIPFDIHLMLKVVLEREEPEVESVSDIWKTADWHEREAYDLLGIRFTNHPDLRRILLPDDWEGFPLRKDYVAQERYHKVKVKY